jgi:hypothetical protein
MIDTIYGGYHQQLPKRLTVQQQRDALAREREMIARERPRAGAMAREASELQKQRDAAARAASEQTQREAIARAAGDVQRVQAILDAPEAAGRERFATFLAYVSDCTVVAARAAMAKAGYEPGSAPALALEARTIADRIVGKPRP